MLCYKIFKTDFSYSCTHNWERYGGYRTTWWKLEFPTDVQIDWIDVWNRLDLQYRIDKVKVTNIICTFYLPIQAEKRITLQRV